jgi:hypothetical protein
MKLAEIASRIDARLKRFYAMGKPAESGECGPLKMWSPGGVSDRFASYYGGSRIAICYVSYQGNSQLTKAEAVAYLEALDNGYVGRHHNCPAVVRSLENRPRGFG